MQLNTLTRTAGPATSRLRLALAAATGALLAAGPALAQLTPAAATGTPATSSAATGGAASVAWQADAAVLQYTESNGRVKATEPMVALRRSDGDDRVTSLRLTLDSLTGASPTGAVPQPVVQTITSASGASSYATSAGAVPVDRHFKDRRYAGVLSHEQPLGEGRHISVGGQASGETDFASIGLNVALAQDFDQRNTTLSLGLAWERDLIKPVGRTPAPLQPHTADYRLGTSRTRVVNDVLIGLTQVINRRWLTQLNLGLGSGGGYFNDPYKVLSVVDGTTGIETGDNKVSESRPRTRKRTTLYWQHKLHVDTGVVDLAWRGYRDDWGIRATTLEARYRHALGGGWFVEPQLRSYRQTAADFYRAWLVEGVDYLSSVHAPTAARASADPRLAAFKAQTTGLKLGLELGQGRELGVRVASYRQKNDAVRGAPGYLASVPLVDDLKATMVMVGYSHLF
ncbi:MAG: hypothetical protein RIQ60_544 [Pseudomonadota bacterium]|jgi:hypothetical protein